MKLCLESFIYLANWFIIKATDFQSKEVLHVIYF